jgi:hypothetical protein
MISGTLKSHKNIKLSLYLFKHHVMKILCMVNRAVVPHILKLSNGGERFTAAMGKSPSTHWMAGLFGPRASGVVVAEE